MSLGQPPLGLKIQGPTDFLEVSPAYSWAYIQGPSGFLESIGQNQPLPSEYFFQDTQSIKVFITFPLLRQISSVESSSESHLQLSQINLSWDTSQGNPRRVFFWDTSRKNPQSGSEPLPWALIQGTKESSLETLLRESQINIPKRSQPHISGFIRDR